MARVGLAKFGCLIAWAALAAACSPEREGATGEGMQAGDTASATASSASQPAPVEEEPIASKEDQVNDAELTTTGSGLKYKDLSEGSGEEASRGEVAVVHYTGWLVDGTKFDSSLDRGTPFEFPVGGGRVIKGWDEGVAGMKVGGRRRLVIPADLGYGATGTPGGPIPPGATLIFEVELLEVKPA
ncbi:MAG: FKBP-type peptidyl-prolyl cis-trans isomerase [Gemmatimonadota bacterium]